MPDNPPVGNPVKKVRRPSKRRLDQLLVERELVHTLEQARACILAGLVRAGDRVLDKAGESVPDDLCISVKQKDCPYVSWGGLKLARGIEAFGVSVAGRNALDIGASSGGFSDVLLQNGAAHVTALDVGYGILDWKVRSDPRVTVIERTNFRTVSDDFFAAPFDLITVDVSFISLGMILPKARRFLTPDGVVLALVKPQFEARRDGVGEGGIVRNPAVHLEVLTRLASELAVAGMFLTDFVAVPVVDEAKNREFISRWDAKGPALDTTAIKSRL